MLQPLHCRKRIAYTFINIFLDSPVRFKNGIKVHYVHSHNKPVERQGFPQLFLSLEPMELVNVFGASYRPE